MPAFLGPQILAQFHGSIPMTTELAYKNASNRPPTPAHLRQESSSHGTGIPSDGNLGKATSSEEICLSKSCSCGLRVG